MDPTNFRERDASAIDADVRYALQVANAYKGQIEHAGLKLEGLNLLELGPGINFGAPLIWASLGAHVSVADRFLTPWQIPYHPACYAALCAAWEGPDDALRRTIEDGGYEHTLRLIDQPAEALSDIADGTVDVVVSNAVLEHVYDFAAVAREMARITRPGGINFHQIDYRDHRSNAEPLEFLLEDQDAFEAEFARMSGERGNRVRAKEAQDMFEAAGFTTRLHHINQTAEEEYFSEFLPRLRQSSTRYRDWPEDDLRNISGLLIVVL